MSYFVVFSIGHTCGPEITGFAKPSEALIDAEDKMARYPLVIVAEDFGAVQRMGLLKVYASKDKDAPQPRPSLLEDIWLEEILSSYGGRWQQTRVQNTHSTANACAADAKDRFACVGPKPFILYPIDADADVIAAEIKSCDCAQEADDLLADMQRRFAGVVVVDTNVDGEDGPYPLYIVGAVQPPLAFELAQFGRSLERECKTSEPALVH